MSRNAILVVVVVVLLVLAGWYLMSQRYATTPTPTQPTPPSNKTATPTSTSSGQMAEMREIKVSGSEFAFTPPTLSIKAGEKVKLTFQNNGKFPHNLTIDKLRIATKTIGPGQTDTIEVTADQTGTYVMYCSVDAHRQKGMEGSVQVQ